VRGGDLGGAVGGAVDHDEHVHRHAAAAFRNVLQHFSDGDNLVVRRDDDHQFGEVRLWVAPVEVRDGQGVHLVGVVGESGHAVTAPTSSRK
jgi:hypothetical protein